MFYGDSSSTSNLRKVVNKLQNSFLIYLLIWGSQERWLNEQESTLIGGGSYRLPTLSGAGTAFPDSEGDSVAPKRRGDSTGNESERVDQPVRGGTSPSDEQFINGRCSFCNHPRHIHFEASDSIGTWVFCVIENCECFKDWRADDDA